MPPQRLSALDASFLAVEGPSAHMHVGWAATFEPPEHGPRPELRGPVRAHRRPARPAPRASASGSPPTRSGCNAPLWIDAEDFDPAEHIHRSAAEDLPQLADAVLSEPLRRDRPLWEFWIADRLRDGRIGLVGKAHHCMVDGLAAVELGSLLLDPAPETAAPPRTTHRLAARPDPPRARAAGPRRLGPHARAARAAAPPARARPLAARDPRLRAAHRPRARRRGAAGRAASALNEPGSPDRHLATARRPLERAARDQRGARRDRQRRRCSPPSPARCAVTPSAPRSARATSRRWCRSTSAAATTAASSATASRSCSSSCPPRVADPFVRLQLIGDATRVAQGVGRARGRRRRAQGAVLRAAAGAEGGRARARQPARLQPRRLQHPRPADRRCTCAAAACTTPTRSCRCRRATRCRSA